jgi:hypothetical protein
MGMGAFNGIWLVVLGGLGAASLLARRPEGRKVLTALEPYQGWIGVLSVVFGLWQLILGLMGAGFIRWGGLGWLLRIADGLLLAALGLVLGVGILRTFVKSAAAQAKLDAWTRSLQPYRERLGITAMVLGGYLLLRAIA